MTVEASDLVSDGDLEGLWAKMQDSYKMRGYFVDSPEVIRAIDSSVGPGESSTVFNFTLKKDGMRSGKSGGVSEAEFAAFRSVFRKTLKDLCTRLTSGELEVAPRKIKKKTPCEHCDYKSICAFDTAFEGNRYH